MAEIINIPEEYRPAIEDLPGELRRIAEGLEEHVPGEGVRLTLLIAQIFGGQYLYIRQVRHIIRQWRDDAIRARYDQGDVIIKDLAVIYKLSQSSIEKILAKPSSQAELKGKQMELFKPFREDGFA